MPRPGVFSVNLGYRLLNGYVPACFPKTPRGNLLLVYCLLISALTALTNWFLLPLPRVLASSNWSSQRIGWIMGMFLGIWTISQLLSGVLARQYGNRTLALAGSALGICSGCCYFLFPSFPYMILPARILHGAGSAFVYSGVLYLLLDGVLLADRAKTIGFYGLPGVAMSIVGPAIAETIERYWGVVAILSLVAPVFCVLLVGIWKLRDSTKHQDVSVASSVGQWQSTGTKIHIILMLMISVGACSSVWQTFLAPLVTHLGPGALSNFAIGHGLGAIMSRLSLGARIDKGKARLAAVLGLVFFGGGLTLLPKAHFGWQFAIIGLVSGITYGLAFIAVISLAFEKMLPQETTVGTALLLASIGLGGFLGPPIWGAVVDKFGYNVCFILAGCALTVASLAFVVVEFAKRPTHNVAR